MPGVNDVDEKEWAEALKAPAFKALVDNGTFEVVQAGKEGAPATADISKMPPHAAIELVQATVSAPLLHDWAGTEKRPSVLEAIHAQQKSIDPRKKG
jgi:hypothetical protein